MREKEQSLTLPDFNEVVACGHMYGRFFYGLSSSKLENLFSEDRGGEDEYSGDNGRNFYLSEFKRDYDEDPEMALAKHFPYASEPAREVLAKLMAYFKFVDEQSMPINCFLIGEGQKLSVRPKIYGASVDIPVNPIFSFAVACSLQNNEETVLALPENKQAWEEEMDFLEKYYGIPKKKIVTREEDMAAFAIKERNLELLVSSGARVINDLPVTEAGPNIVNADRLTDLVITIPPEIRQRVLTSIFNLNSFIRLTAGIVANIPRESSKKRKGRPWLTQAWSLYYFTSKEDGGPHTYKDVAEAINSQERGDPLTTRQIRTGIENARVVIAKVLAGRKIETGLLWISDNWYQEPYNLIKPEGAVSLNLPGKESLSFLDLNRVFKVGEKEKLGYELIEHWGVRFELIPSRGINTLAIPTGKQRSFTGLVERSRGWCQRYEFLSLSKVMEDKRVPFKKLEPYAKYLATFMPVFVDTIKRNKGTVSYYFIPPKLADWARELLENYPPD
jgi:hypothetical protein